MRTLLLDSSFFPVKIIGWQKAIILLLGNRAEVVDVYDDVLIRSVSIKLPLPRVLKLHRKHKVDKTVKFTRQNVFGRDKYKCQYCGIGPNFQDLTFDHVIPLCKGGPTNWENVVTACKSCNSKKGPHLPKEVGLKLIRPPRTPHWTPYVSLRLKSEDPDEWWSWFGQSKHLA